VGFWRGVYKAMESNSSLISIAQAQLRINSLSKHLQTTSNSKVTSKLANMSGTDYKFEGWMGLGPDCVDGKMVWQEFTPKTWEETDVDIKISHCGICGSDLHVLRSGWVSLINGKTPEFKLMFNITGPNFVPMLCRTRTRW